MFFSNIRNGRPLTQTKRTMLGSALKSIPPNIVPLKDLHKSKDMLMAHLGLSDEVAASIRVVEVGICTGNLKHFAEGWPKAMATVKTT
jgi:hypothetical protein